MAIASLVLAILSFLFPLLAIPAIILSIGSIFKIRENPALLKGTRHATAAILISMTSMVIWIGACVVWSLDAAPIPNDYTIADLRSAPSDCAQSYQHLKTLLGTELDVSENSAIVSEEDLKMLNEFTETINSGNLSEIVDALNNNKDRILQAWTNSRSARDLISELNLFSEIADLTEPNVNADMLSITNLIGLARLYQAYAYLEIQQDSVETLTHKLIEFDSFVRKFSPNARPLIAKLVCFICISRNMATANTIVNSPTVSRETVQLLADRFKPLTNEHTSFKNPIMFEYLFLKEGITSEFGGRVFECNPLFKVNSTLRLYKNTCDEWLAIIQGREESDTPKLSVWPLKPLDRLPVSISSQGRVPCYYKCYNPLGSVLIRMMTGPRLENIVIKVEAIKVQDDLLQIVLNKRLGKEISLKARAYSDEYIIDVENKKIFNPGPDGQPHTEDDIKLIINPEVLGFSD